MNIHKFQVKKIGKFEKLLIYDNISNKYTLFLIKQYN